MSGVDQGAVWTDGVFANPVISGMHPDPSVCRVGEDYFLACSSFEYFPGVPILHSRDLVHWAQIGNALDRPSQLSLPPGTPSSGGVYAPTLRHHDGRFWLITTNVAPGGGAALFSSTDPAGPWSDPVHVPGVGIDPDLAWDDQGRCWCTFAGIHQVRIDPLTGRSFGPPRRLWSGTPGAQAPEAPHLYRIEDHWYLLISEGGTERGHAVAIARAPAPDGPFEPCPRNPLLTHRGTESPIQNTGHADLVQAPDRSWWMSLRSRPDECWSTTDHPGCLTLHARGESLDDPGVTFMGRRQEHLSCRTRTLIEPGRGRGGLAVRLDKRRSPAASPAG